MTRTVSRSTSRPAPAASLAPLAIALSAMQAARQLLGRLRQQLPAEYYLNEDDRRCTNYLVHGVEALLCVLPRLERVLSRHRPEGPDWSDFTPTVKHTWDHLSGIASWDRTKGMTETLAALRTAQMALELYLEGECAADVRDDVRFAMYALEYVSGDLEGNTVIDLEDEELTSRLEVFLTTW